MKQNILTNFLSVGNCPSEADPTHRHSRNVTASCKIEAWQISHLCSGWDIHGFVAQWPERAGAGLRCVQQSVLPSEAQLRGHSQERGMECPSWLFWRGEKHPEHFALLQLGGEGRVCAPRISQVSPREGWELRASFSASHARTLASSFSLIFIHVCNSHQGISTRASNQHSRSLWGQGQSQCALPASGERE